MKIQVRESQIVLVLTKAEAKYLHSGFERSYFQNTKLKDSIIRKLEDEIIRAGAQVGKERAR